MTSPDSALPKNVSLVIPAMNEAGRLPSSLSTIAAYREAHPGVLTEVIVVDDGSTDGTAAAAGTFPFVRVVTLEVNRGKGCAIRRGVEVAAGEFILVSDADLSTPIEELRALAAALDRVDIAMGSRALEASRVEVHQAWYRQSMGKTFNLVMRAITGIPFQDTQCGFKLLRGDAARRIFAEARVDRFAWDVEMLLLASRMGLSAAEVPVRWVNSPDSRVRVVRDSLRMLADTIALRVRLGRWGAH